MMPPVIKLVALMAVLATLGVAGVLIYAGIQRYRGRPISRATVRLGAGLFGASNAIAFLFLPELWVVASFLPGPALVIYWLLRRGDWVAAGTLLIVLGLPGAVWWGYYLVQDALDPFVSYDSVLWLWWAPEVMVIFSGALLVARGDREMPAPLLFAKAPAHVRDPAAIGSAILRATTIGPIAIQTLIGVGAALVITGIGLPLAVRAGLPWPVAVIAGTVAFAVVGVELNYVAIPRRVRRAWEGFAVVGNPATKRWRAVVGTPVPHSLPGIRRWLERTPERPETRWARAEGLLLIGDLDEARAVMDRMPILTASDRFEQQTLHAYLAWIEGGEPDFDALRAGAETVGEPGSSERLAARGRVVLAVARDLAASGGDWMAPLIALRDEAGRTADGLLREDLRRVAYPRYALYGSIVSSVALLGSGMIP
jgi:hypothetical protein